MFENLFQRSTPTALVSPEAALPGRAAPVFPTPEFHAVLGTPLAGPWPEGTEVIYFGLGCFWGAEREFWQMPGVVTTAAGYQGGFTPNPLYEEVCTSRTGHTEIVMVAYNPRVISDAALVAAFWEMHDPTQGFRQGNDVGSQYRSAIYWTTPAQQEAIAATQDGFARGLEAAGFGAITTEVRPAAEAGPFYYAEANHQQYLHTNPNGYCPVHSTGVACQV